MLIIGSHVSFDSNEQLVKSVKEAISYNANCFMFYTGAPQNTKRSSINDLKTLEALNLMKENNIDFSKVIVHAPYIINLANRLDEEKFSFSVRFLKEEIERVQELGCKYLVLHPGSHVSQGTDVGIQNIIDGLNKVLDYDTNNVMILLETMAGKGTEVGVNFDEIKKIIDGVNKKERIGVCLDTCHLNDSGYAISKFDDILNDFDKIIGIERIKCVHVNDSKNDLGTHKDRHENIGFGTIGFDSLISVLYNERLDNIPKILETPYVDKEFAPYKYEIEMIRSKVFDKDLIDKIKNQK